MNRFFHFFHSQKGYFRLYSGLVMTFTLLSIVLLYQGYQGHIRKKQFVAEHVLTGKYLQLFPQTLPPLSQGFYEVIVSTTNGKEVSLGKFNIDANENVTDVQGRLIDNKLFTLTVNSSDLARAKIMISSGATAGGNQQVEFLAGGFDKERALMSFDTTFLSDVSGEYMLATPTDGSLVNERSGVWFGDVATNQSFLNLPVLPEGWIYEGWVDIDGQMITSGRFLDGKKSDRFNGFSDNKAGAPAFPGEDFLKNPPVNVFPNLTYPIDIGGNKVMISVEPDIKGVDPTGSAQFPLVILTDSVSSRAVPRRLSKLEKALETPITATLVIR